MTLDIVSQHAIRGTSANKWCKARAVNGGVTLFDNRTSPSRQFAYVADVMPFDAEWKKKSFLVAPVSNDLDVQSFDCPFDVMHRLMEVIEHQGGLERTPT
ncbi:MAG: hypothetical protein RIA08_10035 [Roseovarius sp.]|uniref:hypothetical protein n=1 Tax=Roseovarius sp. TaxID=1486281 RepID=UPI0032ED1873